MTGIKNYNPGADAVKPKTPTRKTPNTFLGCQYLYYLLALITICLPARLAMALGTPPGTIISDHAVVYYIVEGDSYTRNSNVTMGRVDELVDVSVVWQDTGPISVNPGDTNRVLTFRVTNTGNGTEAFRLSVDNTSNADEYNPSFVNMVLDRSGNGIYDAGLDEPYVPTVNDPVLPADESTTVFVLNDIPVGISDGDRGNSRLAATSKTGTGAPGSIFALMGDDNTDAVLGTAGGNANATGTYFASATTVSVVKTALIADPMGGTEPVTGAVITYSITVTVSGPGTAENMIITDAVPANTTYRTGSLALNSVSLTDAVDTDSGDVGGSIPGVITVEAGELNSASPEQIITFDVIIN